VLLLVVAAVAAAVSGAWWNRRRLLRLQAIGAAHSQLCKRGVSNTGEVQAQAGRTAMKMMKVWAPPAASRVGAGQQQEMGQALLLVR
jgi:hypothetical protein